MKRPNRILRSLYRLPLLLRLIGVRRIDLLSPVEWIIVTTRGRRTGKPYSVVLDVVGRDAPGRRWYVQPANGRSSDWARNVAVNPLVEAELGSRRFSARVEDVSGREGAEIVLRFIRTHPWYARLVVWLGGYTDRMDRPDDELRASLLATPVFSIRELTAPGD